MVATASDPRLIAEELIAKKIAGSRTQAAINAIMPTKPSRSMLP
jgi:hypothetical protein